MEGGRSSEGIPPSSNQHLTEQKMLSKVFKVSDRDFKLIKTKCFNYHLQIGITQKTNYSVSTKKKKCLRHERENIDILEI